MHVSGICLAEPASYKTVYMERVYDVFPSQMGFDGLFFARNDYDDKNQRLKDNTMEMVWRPSKSLGNASDLFTGITLFHYGPPPGFCFDLLCADPPIQV